MATRKKTYIWLRPDRLHRFNVTAWGRSVESDPSDSIILRTSALPVIQWDEDALEARPIFWNRSIRVTWNPLPARYRKWFNSYCIYRNNVDLNGHVNEATILQAGEDQEDSEYFLARTPERTALFSGVWRVLYQDREFVEDNEYEYWVFAYNEKGNPSGGDDEPYLGPNSATWGKPQDPQWRKSEWVTQVHELNKWWCDVKVVWKQLGSAEHYLFQRKLSAFGQAFWSIPQRIDFDDTSINNVDPLVRSVVLRNFLCNQSYDFRIRAINVPGVLRSNWVETTYTTQRDTAKPDEIEGVAARRTWYSGTALVQKGEYIKLNWNMPANPIINQQLDHYEIWRMIGNDSDANSYRDQINALDDLVIDYETTDIAPYTETAKFLGTQLIDDDVEGQETGSGLEFGFTWTVEGDDDTERRTAQTSQGSKVGTLGGGAVISSAEAYQGTYSLQPNAGYIQFDNSVEENLNGDEGYAQFWWKGDFTSPSSNQFLYLFGNSLNQLYITQTVAGGLYVYRRSSDPTFIVAQATIPYAVVSAADPFTNWVKIECRWSVASNLLEIRINEGTWYNQGATTLTSFAIAPTTFLISNGMMSSNGYMDNVNISLSYDPPESADKYHYWVRGVDVYGYKSLVTGPSDSPNASYDSVSFEPPASVENLTSEVNLVINKWIKLYSFKLNWDPINEATHYQVQIRLKPKAFFKNSTTERPFGPWMTSPFLEESKHVNDEGRAEYVYPFPLAHETGVEARVRALNRAGASDEWEDIVEIESITIIEDTEGPGDVTNFSGDCMGIKPLFGDEFWLSVVFKWTPRPWDEGNCTYRIEGKDKVAGWGNPFYVADVEKRGLVNSRFFPNSYVTHVALTTVWPLNARRDALTNEFRIKAIDPENQRSDNWVYCTVNWERWWVF
jgi:hypothetical protein